MHRQRLAFTIFFTAGILFLLNLARSGASEEAIPQSELLRRTQELFDAVSSGNQTPWKKYFADDCLYFDEKGRNMDKAALVADITPLPAGYSGAIKMTKVQIRAHGDTVILSYDLDETETIFGQNLIARYHVTDTWMRHNGDWQIVAGQVFRYYEDPAIGKVDPKKLNNFIGNYELAPGQARTVSAVNNKLFVERNGKRDQLFPETSEIFFRKGVEGRILFRYDDTGKVDALIDRRNNEDVLWGKAK
jgi:ketosteroid isomerase-like protein